MTDQNKKNIYDEMIRQNDDWAKDMMEKLQQLEVKLQLLEHYANILDQITKIADHPFSQETFTNNPLAVSLSARLGLIKDLAKR